MKKNHKKERLLAWIVTVIVILLVVTLLGVGFMFAKDPVMEMIQSHLPQKEEAVPEETVSEEQVEVPEEETEPVYEEEPLDEEALDEIFSEDEEEEPEVPEEEPDPYEEEAQSILAEMSNEQKAAQLFFVQPEAITGVTVATAAGDATKEALEKYPVGGIILFKDNIEDPEQITEMTGNLQSYSHELTGLPILIGVDEEGGSVLRLGGNSAFDVEQVSDMRSIGDAGDTQAAYDAGATIGAYLAKYGFNMDFAPDADVITEESNTVIGDRSFGTDGQVVSDMAVQYYHGLQDQGVLACAKHFPGHGATAEDSHDGQAVVDKSWDELETEELIPFHTLISEEIPMIMVGHISLPQITGDDTPASLSSILMTEKLRDEMGYQGLIITDALNMGAVTDQYSSGEAAVKALSAGADVLLMPENFEEAYNAVLEGLSDGTLSQEQIDNSVLRILKAKLAMDENSDSTSQEQEESAEGEGGDVQEDTGE